MKNLFTISGMLCTAVAATMMLASCSNEITETSETVKNAKADVPVTVKLYTGKSTRATEITPEDVYKNLELAVFKKAADGTLTNLNASTSIDAQGNVTIYSNGYLLSWPTDGSSLVFAAQAGAKPTAQGSTSDFVETATNSGKYINDNFRMNLQWPASPYNADIVAGYKESTLETASDGSVELSLSHIYASVNFTVKAPDTNVNYNVQSVEIVTVKSSSDTSNPTYYDLANGAWAGPITDLTNDSVQLSVFYNRTAENVTTAGTALGERLFVYPYNDTANKQYAKVAIVYGATKQGANGVEDVNFGNDASGNPTLTKRVTANLDLVKGENQRYTITLPSTSASGAKVIVDTFVDKDK